MNVAGFLACDGNKINGTMLINTPVLLTENISLTKPLVEN